MTEQLALAGDSGGTNVRFARVDLASGGCSMERVLACQEYASPESAIRHYLEETGIPAPQVICLAVAGPVRNNAVNLVFEILGYAT